MIARGKRSIAGIRVDVIDYEAAVEQITAAALARHPFSVCALPVHGIMAGVEDPEYRYRINRFDLLCPDGQPVRWALNRLHSVGLAERVRGPDLMLHICERAAAEGLGVFLYGTDHHILRPLAENLQRQFPGVDISGLEAGKFRAIDEDEQASIIRRIRESGAAITFVALGCPRQEIFAYELRDALSMPVIAVGAAFPFHAGMIAEAPRWMQQRGLEWAFRLSREPRRLWRRYLRTNPAYVAAVTLQSLGLRRFDEQGRAPRPGLIEG